jgi:hypothetical protein
MANIFEALFGNAPDYSGALSPEQMDSMRKNAALQGGIGSLVTLLGMSGAQPRQIGTGQALGAALGAGFGGYQSSFDNTLKQMLAAQQLGDYKAKKQKQALFEQAMAGAYETKPIGVGLTQTGVGSQAQMLQDQMKDFGEEGTQANIRGLQSNPNLPMQKTVNFDKLVQAISIVDPVEAAKLMVKTDSSPEAIKTFEAYAKMPPEQQSLFRQYKQLSTPNTTNVFSLSEKGLDKIDSDRVGEFSQAAASSRMFAQTASTVNALLAGKGGGELVKVGTGLAKDLGLKNEQVSANDLAQSLATRAAVGVRQPGSGSTSDIEFKAYMSSVPSLSNSEPGRALMAAGAEAFAKRNSLLSDKARELYKKGTYSDAAIAQYDNSLGSVIDQKQFDAVLKTPGAANKPTQRRSFITSGQ